LQEELNNNLYLYNSLTQNFDGLSGRNEYCFGLMSDQPGAPIPSGFTNRTTYNAEVLTLVRFIVFCTTPERALGSVASGSTGTIGAVSDKYYRSSSWRSILPGNNGEMEKYSSSNLNN
jgi:hypothetical protein